MVDQVGIGSVKVSDEVIATIASVAATQIEGVAGMSEGIVDGLAKIITGGQATKGIKVSVGEEEAAIDISVIVEYGYSIAEIGRKIQECVKNAVESMTGLKVVEVNVYIQGVHLIDEKNDEKHEKGRKLK
ncbi:Asp23/Gls24 family envelope stress response protein [bacterium]|nr:Asp23/Gls24 family envelope stress response protein [bacterium]MBU1752768.1 Asp23/Gls24 family envelope stress response protein [bacterium]